MRNLLGRLAKGECGKGKGYSGADFIDLKIISWNVYGLGN